MGCSLSVQENQRQAIDFEKLLKIKCYNINDIKLAFSNLYQNNDLISKQNLIIGFKKLLKQEQIENQLKLYLDTFILQFQKQNIIIQESDDYDFRNIIGILFLLSGSKQKDKAKAIFQLYDYGDNNEFSYKEVQFMLNQLFKFIWKYTLQLQKNFDQNYVNQRLNHIFNSKQQQMSYLDIDQAKIKVEIQDKQDEQVVLNSIDRIVKIITQHIFDNENYKEIDQNYFIKKMNESYQIFNQNILTVNGIRNILNKEVCLYNQIQFDQ